MKRLNSILGYNNLHIFQDSDCFAFSLDSIILANYASIRKRDKVIVDFCTGNGIIPIILSQRTNKKILGIEIQEKLAKLAVESVEYNNLSDQIEILSMDVKSFSLDHVSEVDLLLCNPPYFKIEDGSTFNISIEKQIARHEILLNLEELCGCAKRVLKDNGNFCMVHRSERLMDILSVMRKHKLEPKNVFFVYENIDQDSNLIFIQAQKSGKVGLKVNRPLILYNKDGSLTEEYMKLQKEVRK